MIGDLEIKISSVAIENGIMCHQIPVDVIFTAYKYSSISIKYKDDEIHFKKEDIVRILEFINASTESNGN